MAKQPQDHRKPASKRVTPEPHDRDDRFVFEGQDVTIDLPYIENIKMGSIRKATSGAESEQEIMFNLFSDILGEDEAEEKLDEMTLGEFKDLNERWNEESAITLGERAAS